jgi:hypothetical protein
MESTIQSRSYTCSLFIMLWVLSLLPKRIPQRRAALALILECYGRSMMMSWFQTAGFDHNNAHPPSASASPSDTVPSFSFDTAEAQRWPWQPQHARPPWLHAKIFQLRLWIPQLRRGAFRIALPSRDRVGFTTQTRGLCRAFFARTVLAETQDCTCKDHRTGTIDSTFCCSSTMHQRSCTCKAFCILSTIVAQISFPRQIVGFSSLFGSWSLSFSCVRLSFCGSTTVRWFRRAAFSRELVAIGENRSCSFNFSSMADSQMTLGSWHWKLFFGF